MKSNQEVLNSMLHTVQMGQHGIESVLNCVEKTQLKEELLSQKKEYDSFEHRAKQIAANHNMILQDINPMVLTMSKLMSRARLMAGDVDSKIAGMMIQGNTRGMITGLKNLHKCTNPSGDVTELAQQLLNRETINIQKTQPYL